MSRLEPPATSLVNFRPTWIQKVPKSGFRQS
jgi:hypothetical protein